MKINEFRLLLSKSTFDDVIKIASELYKCIPKAVKENSTDGIDVKIRMILTHEEDNIKSIKNQCIDYAPLHNEIETFIENVYNENYIKQNRIISKTQRSKWRFLVMRFIKDIQKINCNDSNYTNSNIDLLKIYTALAHGCKILVFRSENPFASISKNQCEFYELLCTRIFATGFNREMLSQLIEACSMVGLEEDISYISLIQTLLQYIEKESDILHTIKIANEMIENISKSISGKKIQYSFLIDEESISYNTKITGIENIAVLIMGLYFKMAEFSTGCDFYWNTCEKYEIHIKKNDKRDIDKERLFYYFLQYVECFSQNDMLWVEMYEKYKNDITPRQSLVQTYEDLKHSTTES